MTHRPALVLIAALLLLCTLSCSAKTVYVKLDSPGPTFDGTSWDTAYHAVQAGLNASVSADEVWVAKGIYVERITLKLGVGLYGGFLGTETSRNQRDFRANVTILDGAAAGSVVTSPVGAVLATTIDGFIVRNGRARYGAGIYCTSSSPTISNNVITANRISHWDGGGSGIYCSSSSPLISDCVISSNATDNPNCMGGGIACNSSDPTIIRNTITENRAWSGAGIYCSASSPVIDGNVISKNLGSGAGGGGGVYCCRHSSAKITNNVITQNSIGFGGGVACESSSPIVAGNTITANSAEYAGALECTDSSSPVVTNNTMVANVATYDGGGMRSYSSSPILVNNVIAFNSSGLFKIVQFSGTPALRNNCVYANTGYDYSGISPGAGDIATDPLFVERANRNYHLLPTSPCINSGWNGAANLPLFDMDSEGRIFGRKVDMGADEWWSPVMSITDARLAADGAQISGQDAIVSAEFDGFFYIEREDRSSGIRVGKADHVVQVGNRVIITGSMNTNADGERYIEALTVVADGAGSIAPIGLLNRSIGGANWFYSPTTGAGQNGQKEYRLVLNGGSWTRTFLDAPDLNNIGLLVSTSGRVTHTDSGFFYLDDGSKLDDGSGYIGVKVRIEGLSMPAFESYVKVTGASSCYKRDGNLFRLIRATQITPVP